MSTIWSQLRQYSLMKQATRSTVNIPQCCIFHEHAFPLVHFMTCTFHTRAAIWLRDSPSGHCGDVSFMVKYQMSLVASCYWTIFNIIHLESCFGYLVRSIKTLLFPVKTCQRGLGMKSRSLRSTFQNLEFLTRTVYYLSATCITKSKSLNYIQMIHCIVKPE